MVSRRHFLAGSVALLGANLTQAAHPVPLKLKEHHPAPTEQLALFVDLSCVLTGYTRETLAPKFDTLDLKNQYYWVARKQLGGETLDGLLNAFGRIRQLPEARWPQAVESQILRSYGLGGPARQLIMLWYTGAWYNEQGDMVVSSKAYTNGLVWDTIQAHPMGYSEFHFGYWAEDPVPAAPLFAGEGEAK